MSAEKKKTTPFGKSEGAEPERFIPDGMGMFQRNVKRIGDCALAFLALIVFSPLFLLCYIAVKREDGGPAIFRQERIGRFGRPFNIYKFRSMRLDAEKFGPALYKGGADPRIVSENSSGYITWTSCPSYGMFLWATCPLSVPVPSVSYTSTRSWSVIPVTVTSTRSVRG